MGIVSSYRCLLLILHLEPSREASTTTNDNGTQAAPSPHSLSIKGSACTEIQIPQTSVAAQCFCHPTLSPHWGNETVCFVYVDPLEPNISIIDTSIISCAFCPKLHGSADPVSMKSDVIRKRPRHDARFDDMATSLVISYRAPDSSPTLAPDSTARMPYEFGKVASKLRSSSTSSELVRAHTCAVLNPASIAFPGFYHADYIQRHESHSNPLLGSDTHRENEPTIIPRSIKRSLPTLAMNEDASFRLQPDVDIGGLPLHHHHHTSQSTSQLQASNSDLGPMSSSSPSQSPVIRLENVHLQPQSEFSSVNPPHDEPPSTSLDDDLHSQLKKHAGLELALVSFVLSVASTALTLCNPRLAS
jgi:hypothetical protein